ncbi:armadillo-type protein [Naematelia encephala]|uniref:Armadillo-type protein n=1 Tax=Naematelia encephala TaxID=71784 RepID=A0A1Y2B7E2_9TREE|nr:armadillo-type protein [Naematelia encephala]
MPTQLRESQGRGVKLDFPEKLIQAGKRENTDALLKRIKTLHQKLALLEQDHTDVRSLDSVRKPLINQLILHHKDRGVKAYAACCLADLLRLYAPDAPYTGEELRDIFQFFSAQLSLNLKPIAQTIKPLQPSRSKTNDATQSQTSQTTQSQRVTDIPYYTEYCYLLESLATIKSVVLACDVPGGDDLVTGFFENFVQIVRSDMSKNIIRHLVNILVALVEESSVIPSGVLDCIINQFETYASKPDTPSFQLIVDVCNKAPERLQRPIYSHFAEIQVKHGRDPSPQDLKALVESHSLLLTIYRNCPGLLLNVVPLLEENLKAADEIPLRQLSTRTLGRMFGERPTVGTGTADVAKAYPSAWRAWLGRKVDKALAVRLAWVESSRSILTNHPELRKELEEDLVDRIQDSDERIRAAICKIIGSLDYETALHHISSSTLRAVGGRMSDKKSTVRTEAASAMARLWSAAYSNIEINDPEAIRHFAWIPEMLLHSYFTKDATVELRAQVTSTIKSQILPLPTKPDDEDAWVDRLLLVAVHVDDVGFKALERLTGLNGYAKGSSPYRAFVQFCEDNNGGVIDGDEKAVRARLQFVINAISAQHFADPEKARKDMETFAAVNEPRLYKLFKTCVDPHTDLRTLIKARNELLRRLEQSHTDILDTFSSLVDVASFNIVNHSSIPALLKVLQKAPVGEHGRASTAAAARFLALMAKECPPMFKPHIAELVIVMGDKKNEKLSEVALQALAAVCKLDPEYAPDERKVVERAIKIGLEGSPRQAKFAARFVANSKHKEACAVFIDDILARLRKAEVGRLPSYLRALAELALSAVDAFEAKSEQIIKFVLEHVMYKKSPSAGEDEPEEMVEESALEPLDQAKIIGLRVCTHRSLAFARIPDAVTHFTPTRNLLTTVISNEGFVTDKSLEGGAVRQHMRLRAALCVLKLANVRAFDKALGSSFTEFCIILQDPSWTVRHRVLLKLGDILPAQRLSPRWNMVPALYAQDPMKEHIALAKTIMASVVRQCASFPTADRIDRIELPLSRLLWSIAHHPDFAAGWSTDQIRDIARYIEFYLDCVATRDNIGVLYHVVSKIKTVVDIDSKDDVESNRLKDPETRDGVGRQQIKDKNRVLYRLSELAQIIIRNRAEAMHWNLVTYSAPLKLPKEIFHNLTNIEEVREISRQKFLLPDEDNVARSLGRRPLAVHSAPIRRVVDRSSSPAKKRSKGANRSSRKKRRPSEDEVDSDEEDESDDDGEEDTAEEAESEEEADGEAVMGRGGRRGAKTKANKAVAGKKKKTKVVQSDEMDVDDLDA